MTKETTTDTRLVLGWTVTPELDPAFWVSPRASLGGWQDNDLVQAHPESVGNHTVIIAQSGSGKSFFLGRYIEEVMLKTMARVIILDPNADFRRIQEVEGEELWQRAAYDLARRRGKLPHEASRDEFATKWQRIPIRIRTGRRTKGSKASGYEPLQLWWPSLSMDFLAEDVEPMLRSDLYHCHAVVKALGRVSQLKGEPTQIIDEAERVFGLARRMEAQDLRERLVRDFSAEDLISRAHSLDIGADDDDKEYFAFRLGDGIIIMSRTAVEAKVKELIDRLLTLQQSVSQPIERFYFNKAKEYQAGGILGSIATKDGSSFKSRIRLDVVDLPSLPDANTRLVAVNAILNEVWSDARDKWERALIKPGKDDRVPTLIVIDEAHNLIPSEPRGKPERALLEQFRTIAAEGRKYGLYLVLVSQRPDKLDQLVVSECQNKGIMRIGSETVLGITRERLGLTDLSLKSLEKALDFGTGRAMLIGPWAPQGYQIIYSGARRTVEGGRNLDPDHWARPSPDIAPPAAPTPRRAPAKRAGKKRTARKPTTKR
jgi:hypothetical protein